MQDLTTGSLTRHLLKTTGYMLVMMVFQTLYFLIDLYWVGRLGTDAVAGVGIAGNLTFVVLALMQMLSVGTTAVISHAAGRKDHHDAQHLWNQALVLSLMLSVGFLVLGLAGASWYVNAMSADAGTARQASAYLRWFIPAMALQFPLGVMGAALRGIGIFRPSTLVSTVSVVLNMLIAPFLIFGWWTGHAFGVAGAAMSSLISIVIAMFWMATYFLPASAYLHFVRDHWRPHTGQWRRILAIGLPAGFEFGMMAVYLVVVYTIARPFGAAAQAGFGIGQRVLQALILPIVALGFAVAPVAGQNFGAQLPQRVRRTFRDAAVLGSVVTILLGGFCEVLPTPMIRGFSKDPAVIAVGVEYLRIISFNIIATGLIFVASSMFQAMGNTIPSLIASASRILLVAIPGLALSHVAGFQLRWLWYVSTVAVWIQLGIALSLLRREYRNRLVFDASIGSAALASPAAEVVGG